MNDTTEIDESAELNNIEYRTHEDYVAIELDANTKIAEQYGGTSVVHVGTIISRREVYKEPPTLYATVHYPDPTTGGFTPKQVEGHLICSSIAELATVARSLSVGKTLIIDRENLEILETRTY